MQEEQMDKDNIINIGPECFADGDLDVICYKGENYYKSCGEIVRLNDPEKGPDGGYSTCVKRFNHQGGLHQDYEGNMIYRAKEDSLFKTFPGVPTGDNR